MSSLRIDHDTHVPAAYRPVEGDRPNLVRLEHVDHLASSTTSPSTRSTTPTFSAGAGAAVGDLHLVDSRPLHLAGLDVDLGDAQVRQAAVLAAATRPAPRRENRLAVFTDPAVVHDDAVDRAPVQPADPLLVSEHAGARSATCARRRALLRRPARTRPSPVFSNSRIRSHMRAVPGTALMRAAYVTAPPNCSSHGAHASMRTPAVVVGMRGGRPEGSEDREAGWRVERAFV